MVEEKFWEKVNKREENECWEWKTEGKRGYGKFENSFWGTPAAHRISYIINKGEIPEGLLVCHTCDNPPCVNPNHLWVGTHQENSDDMVKKGRNYWPTKT